MNYATQANAKTVKKVTESLSSKGYQVILVKTGGEALESIKKIIPEGASVMNGSSVTLEQIGYIEYLNSGKHKWNNLYAAIAAENDQAKRQTLRKQASIADYYLGSVHALTETGEFIVASNTASQLPSVVYNAQNLIFVVSTKKIVPNLSLALKRVEEYVYPLENKHMTDLYGSGTQINKILIFKGESSYSSRKITLLLVEEDLGF